MSRFPPPLAQAPLIAWRIDDARFRDEWDSGEGAFRYGGRWNGRGSHAVYCSLDAATAILEVAVHKGFDTLDAVAHVITAIEIIDPADVHVVTRDSVPNANWLRPAVPGAGQQRFGDRLLGTHRFVAISSTVSAHSWNLIFAPAMAKGRYRQILQEPFSLDTRLNPPAP